METDMPLGAPAEKSVCMMCNLTFDRPIQDASIRHYIHSQTELQQVEDTFFTVFELLPEHKGKISLHTTPNILPFCSKCVPLVRNLVKIQKKLQDLENQVKRARDEIVSVLVKAGPDVSPQRGLSNDSNFQFKQLICEKWCPEPKAGLSESGLDMNEKQSKSEAAINGICTIKPKPQHHRLSREILSITKRDEADKLLLSMMPEDVEEVTCQLCSKVCRSKEYLETHLRVHAQTTKLTCSFCGKIFLKVAALKKHYKSLHDHVIEEPVENIPVSEATSESNVEVEPGRALVPEVPETVESTKDTTTKKSVEPDKVVDTNEPDVPRSWPSSRRNSIAPKTTIVSPSVSDDRLPPKLVDQTRFDFVNAGLEDEDEEYEFDQYQNGEEEEEVGENEYEGDEQSVEEDPMIDPALFLPQAGKFKYTTKSVIVGYYCRMCRKNYATTSTLRKHIHVVHLKQKRLDCPVCQISVGDHYTLTKHVARHDPALTRVVFNCSECGEGTATRRAIERHYTTTHPDVKVPENPLVRAIRDEDPLDIVIKSEPMKYSSVSGKAPSIRTPVADTTEANTTDEESTTLITPAAAASAVVPVVNRQYTKKKKKPKSVFLYKRKRRLGKRGGSRKTVAKASVESEPEITVDVVLSPPAAEVETVETDNISIKEAQGKNPYLRAMNFNLSLTLGKCDLSEHGIELTNRGSVSSVNAKTVQSRPRRSVSSKKKTAVSDEPAAASEIVPPVVITRGATDWKSKGAWFTQQKSSTLSALTKSTITDGEKSTPVPLPANWKSFGSNSNSLIRNPIPGSSLASKKALAPAPASAAPSAKTQNPNTMLHAMLSSTMPKPKSLTPSSSSTTVQTITTANNSVHRAKTPVRVLPAPPKVKSPEGSKSGYWADPSNILLSSATSAAPYFFQPRSGGPRSPTKTKKLAAIAKSLKRELPKSNAASPKPTLQSSVNKLVRSVKKSGIGNLNAIPFGKGTSNSESPIVVHGQDTSDSSSGLRNISTRPQMEFNFTNRSNDDDDDYIDPSQFLQVESNTDDPQDPAQFIEKSTNSAFRNDFQALLRNPNVKVSMVPSDEPKPSKPSTGGVTRIVSQPTGTLPSGIRLVPVEDVLKGNTEDIPTDPLSFSSPPTKKRLLSNTVPRFLLPKPSTNQSPKPQGEHGQLSGFMTVVSTSNSTSSYSAPRTTGIPLSQIYESDDLDIEEAVEEEEEFSPIRIRSIQSLREPEPPSPKRFTQELAEDVNQYQPKIVTGSIRPSFKINISQARTQPQQTATPRNIIGATPVLLPPITRPVVQGQAQTRARFTVPSQSPRPQGVQNQVRSRQPRPQVFINRKYRADEKKDVMRYSDFLRNKMDQGVAELDPNFQLPIRTSPALQLQIQPSTPPKSNNNTVYMFVPAGTSVSDALTLAGSTNSQSFSTARLTTSTPTYQLAQSLVQVTPAHNQIDINPFLGQ